MLDYGRFCYLDVQKTGGTLIGAVLKEASRLPLLDRGKHSAVIGTSYFRFRRHLGQMNFRAFLGRGGMYRRDCFYFNSVRNPFSTYASLFNYGCDAQGLLRDLLVHKGHGALYEPSVPGFLNWVSFILTPSNAALFDPDFARVAASGLGYCSFRFLHLSVVDPRRRLRGLTGSHDAESILGQYGICRATIRNETLRDDLLALIDGPLQAVIDREAALRVLDGPRINAAQARVARAEDLENSPLAPRIRAADALIFNRFYPEARG